MTTDAAKKLDKEWLTIDLFKTYPIGMVRVFKKTSEDQFLQGKSLNKLNTIFVKQEVSRC